MKKTLNAVRRAGLTTIAGAIAAVALAPVGAAHASDIKERTVKFAFANQTGHPQAMGAQRFSELVAQKSGGKITVKLFPGGALGGDLQTLSAMQGGTVEMAVMNTGLLGGLSKDFGAVDLPFLFNDAKEADAVVDGPFGRKLLDELPAKGLVGLGYWDLGFRNLTNGRRPVTRLEDIAGLKVRVVQTPIYIDLFNALGANATPMPFPELYSALEQRTVDGQENPVTVIASSKFNEVQKHLALTRHTYNPQTVLVSKKFWDGLSNDERKLMQDAADEARTYQRQVSRERESVALDALKKAGMQVTEIAPAELARIRDKVRPVVEKHAKEIGEATVKQLYAEIAKARGGK